MADLRDLPTRFSGVMLPATEPGKADEFIRADIKVRLDSPAIFNSYPQGDSWLDRIVGRVVPGFYDREARLDRALIGSYPRGGHFAWHRDDMTLATANRETAVVVGLSDDYDGGLLELPEAGVSIQVRRGVGVAFPASALHRVTPVTRGVREVLLTFVLKDVP